MTKNAQNTQAAQTANNSEPAPAVGQALKDAVLKEQETELKQLVSGMMDAATKEMFQQMSNTTNKLVEDLANTGKKISEDLATNMRTFNTDLDERMTKVNEAIQAAADQKQQMEKMQKEIDDLKDELSSRPASAPAKPMSRYDKVMHRMAQAGDAFLVPAIVVSTLVGVASLVHSVTSANNGGEQKAS